MLNVVGIPQSDGMAISYALGLIFRRIRKGREARGWSLCAFLAAYRSGRSQIMTMLPSWNSRGRQWPSTEILILAL